MFQRPISAARPLRAAVATAALALACGALAIVPAMAGAHGGKGKTKVSGTYTATDFGTTSCVPKKVDPDILRCSTTGFVSAYDGNLVGSSITDFTEVINCKTGTARGRGVETFTGSLNGGATGTLTWKISFRTGLDCATFAPSDFHGQGKIRSSSGGLSGIHGWLRFGDVAYDGVLRLP